MPPYASSLEGSFPTACPVWCKYSNEPYHVVAKKVYGPLPSAMNAIIQPFHLLVIALAGWLNRDQQALIDYLVAENRVLKDQLGGQRLRFTDEQRIRLAVVLQIKA